MILYGPVKSWRGRERERDSSRRSSVCQYYYYYIQVNIASEIIMLNLFVINFLDFEFL